jgi:hypothetical protein
LNRVNPAITAKSFWENMKKYVFSWVVLLIVTVQGTFAATDPIVNWVRPTNGASFVAGSVITLTAQASDSDGMISFVEFFAASTNNSMLLGRVPGLATNFYSFRWSNAPAGSFQLHAEAVDNEGLRGVSGSVMITVRQRPTIVTHPESQTVPEGSMVTFSVTATGTPPLSYRWRKDGFTLVGATNSMLTLSNVTTSDQGGYSAFVFNSAGSATSSVAVLTVVSDPGTNNLAPVVTWVRPTNGSSFSAGTAIILTARATDSDGTISFVDFFAAATSNAMHLGRVPGSLSNSTYNLVWSNAPSGTFQLHAEAVDNQGARGVSGSAQIFISGGGGTNTGAPRITSQPQSQTVNEGADVTFSVTATGTEPLGYRWRRNGAFIPGANGPTLTLFSVTSSNAGNYAVVITNMFGMAFSSNAVLTVISDPGTTNSPPTVTLISPTNGSVFAQRSPILLRALASDPDGTVSFVDFFANTTRVGRASSTGTNFSTVWSNAPAGTYEIRAVATDNQGAQATSSAATITVLSNRPPTAISQSLEVPENSSTMIILRGTDPDRDPLVYTVVTLPAHGTLSGSGQSVTYTPAPDYVGPDSFTFTVRDREFESAPATVEITVVNVNKAPIAHMTIENAIVFLGAPTIIAVDADAEGNPIGIIILDASGSSDPDGDPLTYFWSIANLPFAAGVRATNEIAPGSYDIELAVTDGELFSTASAHVDVLTPCDAIGLLMVRIAESSLGQGDKRPLIRSLAVACDAFDSGNVATGIQRLEAFQHKVAARIGESDPAFAELLIDEAQRLIDAVQPAD